MDKKQVQRVFFATWRSAAVACVMGSLVQGALLYGCQSGDAVGSSAAAFSLPAGDAGTAYDNSARASGACAASECVDQTDEGRMLAVATPLDD